MSQLGLAQTVYIHRLYLTVNMAISLLIMTP